MTISDFVRAAAERYGFEQDELAQNFQSEVLRQIEQIKAGMAATFADLDAYLAERREPDPSAIRAQTIKEMEALDIDCDEDRRGWGLRHDRRYRARAARHHAEAERLDRTTELAKDADRRSIELSDRVARAEAVLDYALHGTVPMRGGRHTPRVGRGLTPRILGL